MGYETRTCADCGRREPMDLPREVRFAGEYGPLCDDCLPLALRVVEANAADAPADPALLALAKLGALMCQNSDWPEPPESQYQECGYIDLASREVDLLMDKAGLMLPDSDGSPADGVRTAIAALLAPDGAASEGVSDGN